jgi:histidinol dehydrogenase
VIAVLSGPALSNFIDTQCRSSLDASASSVERAVEKSVQDILNLVKTDGDNALNALAQKFGDPLREDYALSTTEVASRLETLHPDNKAIIDIAANNIRTFAEATRNALADFTVRQPGYDVGLQFVPVESAVCYVPGGRYPLPSTALMTGLSAQAAGVPNIYLTGPKLSPEILYAGQLAGIHTFFELGGAQAVAAFAFGTQSIPRVDILVGPGNAYVTEAKRQVQGLMGIDLLAGPSEVTIIADETADPKHLAWDMLAQAEHDPHARSFLFTNSSALAQAVDEQLKTILATPSYAFPTFIHESLQNSVIGVVANLEEAVALTNTVAPEHLELHIASPEAIQAQLKHYGALFIGHAGCVAFGDYAAGPNHTLPTARRARFQGGLTPLTFLRPQSWLKATDDVQALAQLTHDFARLEGLDAHAESAACRIAL